MGNLIFGSSALWQILDRLSHQEAQVLEKKPWHPLVTRTASNVQEHPARGCGQKAPASLNHHLCSAFKTMALADPQRELASWTRQGCFYASTQAPKAGQGADSSLIGRLKVTFFSALQIRPWCRLPSFTAQRPIFLLCIFKNALNTLN